MMAYVFIGVGLVLLAFGSEGVLRGAVGLSRILGLSPLLIGLVIVSAGTSAPELIVSLQAAFRGAPDLAVGNVVGSNIVNILLILGLGALFRPIPSSPKVVVRDGGVMVLASLALVFISRDRMIDQHWGVLLLGGFVSYLVLCFFTDWRRPSPHATAENRANVLSQGGHSLGVSFMFLAFGLVALFFGARYLIDGGVAIARDNHVPEAIIGLTIIALGTSLPELATTVMASIRGQTNIAIGNLIGSNIFNILLVLGATAVVHPLRVTAHIANFDVLFMAGIAVLLVPLMASSWRLSRPQGLFLVTLYCGYVAYLAWQLGLLNLAGLGIG